MPATQITTILLNDIYVCAKVPKIGLFLPRASTVEGFPSDDVIAAAVTVKCKKVVNSTKLCQNDVLRPFPCQGDLKSAFLCHGCVKSGQFNLFWLTALPVDRQRHICRRADRVSCGYALTDILLRD